MMSGADSLRFAGKIYGTKSDYWIAAGRLDVAEEEETDPVVEKRGTGVNTQVYWVTDNLLNDWIQLPDCRPEWIVSARLIKHVFTGDLNASVDCNPQFDGKERHLLRATLARIFAATSIVPTKMYTFDEDQGGKMIPDPEFVMPETDALKALTEWGNLEQCILKNGRTAHLAPPANPADPEFDPEAALAALNEADPPLERFRDLEQHEPIQEGQPSWSSRIVGDTQLYA